MREKRGEAEREKKGRQTDREIKKDFRTTHIDTDVVIIAIGHLFFLLHPPLSDYPGQRRGLC